MNQNSNMAKIAINKSVLKEYENNGIKTVYLKDGTEFQIMIFNSTTDVIGCDISIDGYELNNKLVLCPGQRCWLERYLDKNIKFKFVVYQVDKNDPIVDHAISNNGNIEIRYYKEYKNNLSVYNNCYYISDWYKNINVTKCNDYTILSSSIPSNINTYASTCVSDSKFDYNYKNDLMKETGRIENGGVSNQKFNSVNYTFEFQSFKIDKFKLLPYSEKPYYKKDIEKVYCTECGTKLKPSFKYCPKCGTKI